MNQNVKDYLATEIKALTDASYRQGGRDVVEIFLDIDDQFGAEVMVAGMRQFYAENPSQFEELKNVGKRLGRDAETGSSGKAANGSA